MVKVILFDIDGTLIRTGGAGVKAFAQTCRVEFGVANGSEQMKFAGRTDTSLVREFFTSHNIETSPENFSRFFAAYLRNLEELIPGCEGDVCPGITEGIAALRGASNRP